MTTCRECGIELTEANTHKSNHKRMNNGSIKVDCKACANHKTMISKRYGRRVLGAQWSQNYAKFIKLAMAKWLTEDDWNQINEIYASRKDGEAVDHIIPLRGKLVCGLHVPSNLQVIDKVENMQKSNFFDIEEFNS